MYFTQDFFFMETLRKILIGVVMMFGLWSIQLSGNLHTRTKRPISLRSMLESSLYLHLPTSGDNLCAASKLNPPSIRLSGTGAESHARAEPSATSAGIRASNDQPTHQLLQASVQLLPRWRQQFTCPSLSMPIIHCVCFIPSTNRTTGTHELARSWSPIYLSSTAAVRD